MAISLLPRHICVLVGSELTIGCLPSKYNLSDNATDQAFFKREKRTTAMYIRSAHIVQPLRQGHMARTRRRPIRNLHPDWEMLGDPETLFLEYCPRGDLHKFISRLFHGQLQPQRRFPERLLWHVFGCCRRTLPSFLSFLSDNLKLS